MVADVILAALVVSVVLYQLQDVYGRAYDRRTERLRETNVAFYAAADAVLGNPALQAKDLRRLQIVSEDVASGDQASRYFFLFMRYVAFPIDLSKKPANSIPTALESDVSRLMQATFTAIAERQIVWKMPMALAYRAACMRVKHRPDQSVSSVKWDFNTKLITPA